MRLSEFIIENMEDILSEWEAFASTITPQALTMDSKRLREYAKLMLDAIVLDLSHTQSAEQQKLKSFGLGRLLQGESSAETHAIGRHFSGFSTNQLLSEYRALRASVLRLWAREEMRGAITDADDITRFNEAIDQAIVEAVATHSELIAKAQHLFLAILGHDLRNPMSTTLMASRFILESDDLDKHVVAANRIHNAIKRMEKLVNDLIDYTRTHLGSTLPIIPREMNFEDVCREVLAEHEMAHPNKKFEFHVDGVSGGSWDANRIAQVLSNLLGNAAQYGNGVEPIVLRLCGHADNITVAVENKGEVIPADKFGTLFSPMVRLAEEKNSNSLGIGLYIAKEIVNAHGGTITVTSSKEHGTIFTAVFPRCLPTLAR